MAKTLYIKPKSPLTRTLQGGLTMAQIMTAHAWDQTKGDGSAKTASYCGDRSNDNQHYGPHIPDM